MLIRQVKNYPKKKKKKVYNQKNRKKIGANFFYSPSEIILSELNVTKRFYTEPFHHSPKKLFTVELQPKKKRKN